MDNKVVKWILILVVLGIWINMVRVSVPTILEYFKLKSQSQSNDVFRNYNENNNNYKANQYIVDITSVRNPFSREIESRVSKASKSKESTASTNEKVYSIFNLKGTFVANGKKIAILEGRSDLGVNTVYYASEGDTVMDEKIVEIGENYVIIFKGGEKIVLYEVR